MAPCDKHGTRKKMVKLEKSFGVKRPEIRVVYFEPEAESSQASTAKPRDPQAPQSIGSQNLNL